MKTVSTAEATRTLHKLLRDVQDGESVTITSRGKPVAQLVAARDDAGQMRRVALDKLLKDLSQRPALNIGKFERDWAYED